MLQIRQICKEYRTGDLVQKALDHVDLNLRDNEFVAILGPSGSGKTTLLNIIGGLDRYDSGDLIINGISTKKYKDRDWDSYRNHTIGFVFQSYNLIPHQTVLANVELALTISGIGKTERRQRARKALEEVGLGDQLHKKPSQMSGGQMQRVAIARALVNDPDILLADEPTGALDSSTSVQVMDLLREVAKDRLVVMVTHNPELAQQYATRIVNLRDGQIQSDSDPFTIEDSDDQIPEHKNMGKASMSFFTALSLSFNNLRTKKARTILTAFAGSIGIIGISLILSLSTGVNDYIKNVEEETLSQYPLQIQSTGFDLTSMMTAGAATGAGGSGQEKQADQVNVIQMVTDMFSQMNSNDLESLKSYLDSGQSKIENYTNAIEYSYDVTPQIYSEKDDGSVRQVNPDKSFESLGFGSSESSSSMMSTMMGTDVFYEMPKASGLYESQYDVKAGRWPQNYNECVLVLTANGSISDFLLYTLGLRDSVELEKMLQQFIDEEEIDTPGDMGSYSYDDILGITFKLVHSKDYYQYDGQYGIWRDKSDNEAYIKNLAKEGEDLKIVGIVQPSEDANGTLLSTGIAYPASLTEHIIEVAADSKIVKAQLADRNTNVFTGKAFGKDDNENDFDMQSLFAVDEKALQEAFSFDENALKKGLDGASGGFDPEELSKSLDLSELMDMDELSKSLSKIEAPDMSELSETIQIDGADKAVQDMVSSLLEGYQQYLAGNSQNDYSQLGESFQEYLRTEDAQKRITQGISDMVDDEELQTQISGAVTTYMEQMMSSYSGTVQKALEKQITSAMKKLVNQISGQMENSMRTMATQLGQNIQEAIKVDPQAFVNAFSMNMNAEELEELFASMNSAQSASYENNLKTLGYADFGTPSGIDIYPIDFESKEQVVKILDDYNERMEDAGKEEQVITYTDVVGALMSSVTDIIDTISYVLIAFVAISLIVSSIMIGVITYISVLERKKEIGILRAIGASKGNISQVFNAETFIIGLTAGLIGIGLTLLILIPGNMVIHHIADSNEINAVLPAGAAGILILLSVLLTLIGGLIPSRKAAKSDPVAALRTE
ncbi:ATP-binding cassette domain-containing protein [Zhenpiania hominis]|uniref:ABC transporter ATP-binding protein/permease n=1 Tax=Zhenpiania hominis TaxID=2763644 RepID=UPI0039F5373A